MWFQRTLRFPNRIIFEYTRIVQSFKKNSLQWEFVSNSTWLTVLYSKLWGDNTERCQVYVPWHSQRCMTRSIMTTSPHAACMQYLERAESQNHKRVHWRTQTGTTIHAVTSLQYQKLIASLCIDHFKTQLRSHLFHAKSQFGITLCYLGAENYTAGSSLISDENLIQLAINNYYYCQKDNWSPAARALRGGWFPRLKRRTVDITKGSLHHALHVPLPSNLVDRHGCFQLCHVFLRQRNFQSADVWVQVHDLRRPCNNPKQCSSGSSEGIECHLRCIKYNATWCMHFCYLEWAPCRPLCDAPTLMRAGSTCTSWPPQSLPPEHEAARSSPDSRPGTSAAPRGNRTPQTSSSLLCTPPKILAPEDCKVRFQSPVPCNPLPGSVSDSKTNTRQSIHGLKMTIRLIVLWKA